MLDNYPEKFTKIKSQTLFDKLDEDTQSAVRDIALENFLTLQELKTVVDAAMDLNSWDENDLASYWRQWRQSSELNGREFKKWALGNLDKKMEALRQNEIVYDKESKPRLGRRHEKKKIEEQESPHTIYGMCPVKSDKTLCCNLRTIDAVKNCGFACNYCSIQTMYGDQNIVFDKHYREKLDAIELDPDRHYHIGTGQSSDALMWGNTHHILDDMFYFASKWPKALIEFKTKSKNVDYFLKTEVPRNVVCSWSLNPDVIINNEEHLTASFAERIQAARKIADQNIRIGFHFHPMIHYQGWQEGYTEIILAVVENFKPEEIVFISFGSLTFPKPILKKLRSSGLKSKIYQTPFALNPEGKLTYPDEIKEQLFSHAYETFKEWHDKVFFYLCMEEEKFWHTTFNKAYPDNEAFEMDLLNNAWAKLKSP